MKSFQIGLAVLVLGAVLATAASDRQANTDKANTASGSETASAAYYGHNDVQQLCLRELRQYNCRYVGCPNITSCDSAVGCYDCYQHLVGQSDVVCCPQKAGEYGREATNVFTPSLKVGTCDWDMDVYVCPSDNVVNRRTAEGGKEGVKRADTTRNVNVGCADPIPMENGAYKIGSAWGTCILNADSEYCGHPFCDKMVLSFQGGVYAMLAYAKAGYLPPEYDVEDPSWTGCFPTPDIVPEFNGTFGGNRTASLGAVARKHNNVLKKAIASTGLPQKLAAKQAKQAARASKKAASGKREAAITPAEWEEGLAVVVTGPITVTSLQQKVEYESGMLQYVPSWVGAPLTEGEPGSTAMIVTPYQYDIVLSKDGGYEGGYEGAYKERY